MPGRQGMSARGVLVLVIVLVACAVGAVALTPAVLSGLASARSLPRGELVVATLPPKPAALDRPAIMKQLVAIRSAAKAPELGASSCLDAVAAAYATAVAAAAAADARTVPAPAASSCGAHVDAGWVRGADRTGVEQLRSAMTRGPSGSAPLAADGSKRVGLAVVAVRGPGRSVSGYVLAWAVSG